MTKPGVLKHRPALFHPMRDGLEDHGSWDRAVASNPPVKSIAYARPPRRRARRCTIAFVETVEVAIPLHGCLACPGGCGVRAVNLAGELQPCSQEACPMGTVVRKLTDDEKAKVKDMLRSLQAHVADCQRCQGSTSSREMCAAGGELYGRWLAWLA